nr:peptidyl-tRNA hydrolase protein 1 [Polyrhizophydium stewartii]
MPQWRLDKAAGGWLSEVTLDSSSPLVAEQLAALAAARPHLSGGRLRRDDPGWSRRVLFLKPRSYMNESGVAVGKALKHLSLKPSDCIIVHDDLEKRLGSVTVKVGGSAK